MLKVKSLLDYTNWFSPNKYEKNDKIILKYFQQLQTKNLFFEYILKRWGWQQSFASSVISRKNSKTLEYHIKQFFLIFMISVAVILKNI